MFWQYSRMMVEEILMWDDNQGKWTLSSELFKDLLKASIAWNFNERWYLDRYPDVRRAVRSSMVTSALDHYIEYGFVENRMPFPIEIDEEFYLTEYPDVRKALEAGSFTDPQQHFEEYGFREGRLPSLGWELLAGPATIEFTRDDAAQLNAAAHAEDDPQSGAGGG